MAGLGGVRRVHDFSCRPNICQVAGAPNGTPNHHCEFVAVTPEALPGSTFTPPQYVAVLPLRANAPNTTVYAGERIAASQRAAYPDLQPLVLEIPPSRAFERALATVRATPTFWRVHVFGTSGSAEVLDDVTLVRRRSGAAPETIVYPRVDVLANELTAFADAVDGRSPFPVPQEDVLTTLSAFEGSLHSMTTGQPAICESMSA